MGIRKVVKQTVMTSVYGVTFIGARQQIENRLKEKVGIFIHICIFATIFFIKKEKEAFGGF